MNSSFPPNLLPRLDPPNNHQSFGHAPVASMWTPAELPSSNVPGQVVLQPSANDIILGRGVPISKYEGNIRFRELIRDYKGEYMATGRHHRKQEIVAEVCEKLRERNCRFLSRIETDEEARKNGLPAGSRAWYIASEEAALSKVKQALREMESSSSPKNPKSPARSDSSPARSRKKKPPAREEAADAEGARPLVDPAPHPPPSQQPGVAAATSLSATTAAPPGITPAMLPVLPMQQSQQGWNSSLWPTNGLSQSTAMSALPGQQSFASLLQPPLLHQPTISLLGPLQQQAYLASLTGAPLSFPNTSLANPSGSMAQWLEQQRNEAHERINQHFDGLLREHLLQQQQRQVALWRQQLEAQQSQQAHAQAHYLSQLGTATSNVTRGALLSLSGFNHSPFNLGAASGSNVVNPMQEGNRGLTAAVHNDAESAAVSTDNPHKEGRERRRSEGDNHGATTRAKLPLQEETVGPASSRRRRRQAMDDRKPRARPQGSAAQASTSDESESGSNSSTTSSSKKGSHSTAKKSRFSQNS
jgi:hypothetical protein